MPSRIILEHSLHCPLSISFHTWSINPKAAQRDEKSLLQVPFLVASNVRSNHYSHMHSNHDTFFLTSLNPPQIIKDWHFPFLWTLPDITLITNLLLSLHHPSRKPGKPHKGSLLHSSPVPLAPPFDQAIRAFDSKPIVRSVLNTRCLRDPYCLR